MNKTQFCCDPYKNMAQTFQWFSYEKDGMKIFCMPSIAVDGKFWRVDYCPSCGKPTRSFEIPEAEYVEIMGIDIDE